MLMLASLTADLGDKKAEWVPRVASQCTQQYHFMGHIQGTEDNQSPRIPLLTLCPKVPCKLLQVEVHGYSHVYFVGYALEILPA